VNPKAETVEELLARRKNLHMGMLKLAREDLAITLKAGIDAYKVPHPETTTILSAARWKHPSRRSAACRQSITAAC
jgi:hypothetical protein